MKRPLAFFAASLLLGHSVVSASAAECDVSADRAPLRTAALQQELMVAALQCDRVYEYNQFVLAHQPELIRSDRALETYFQKEDKQRGSATYNKYKTELANAASLRSSEDPERFCEASGRMFNVALGPLSLSEIVASVRLESDRAMQNCPVLAENTPSVGLSPPFARRPPSSVSGMAHPEPTHPSPSWSPIEDDDETAQSLDSHYRSEVDAPPPDWTYDDDPDE